MAKKFVIIDQVRCKGCGLCVRNCPKKILALSQTNTNVKGYQTAVVVDISACIACAACARTCPDVAITVQKETEERA